MLRKFAFILIISILICTISLTFAACSDKELTADSIITIEANAHIEMMIDKNSRVININAINKQGEVLLVGENFEGESYLSAVKKIVQLAVDTGYINNLMKVVSIDTISIDKDVELKINRQLFNAIKAIDKTLEVKAFNYTLEERDYKSFIRNNKGFENFSFLQYRLISNIVRYDSSLTLKQGARLTVSELTNMLIDHYRNLSQYHTYELYSKMSAEGRLYKLDKANKMANLIGGETQQAMELYNKVNIALVEILSARQIEQIPDSLVEGILYSLELTPEQISQTISALKFNDYGYIIGLSLDETIDKIYTQKVFPNATVQEIFDIKIDKAKELYNWQSKPLTDKEKQKIYDLLPTGIYSNNNNLDSIEDIYILIKVLIENLSSKYSHDVPNLSEEVRKQVNILSEELKKAEQHLLEANKNNVDAEFNKLTLEKKKRLENYSK